MLFLVGNIVLVLQMAVYLANSDSHLFVIPVSVDFDFLSEN